MEMIPQPRDGNRIKERKPDRMFVTGCGNSDGEVSLQDGDGLELAKKVGLVGGVCVVVFYGGKA